MKIKWLWLLVILLRYTDGISQVPDLVARTINMKLRKSDFDPNEQLFMTIDTLKGPKSFFDYEYIHYPDVPSFLRALKKFNPFFQRMRAVAFLNMDGNILYRSPKHWSLWLKDKEDCNYRLEWWFSEENCIDPKLRGVTIIFLE